MGVLKGYEEVLFHSFPRNKSYCENEEALMIDVRKTMESTATLIDVYRGVKF